MQISINVNFYLQKLKKEQKSGNIVVRANFDGQTYNTTTGLKATDVQWSAKNQRFKPSASNAHANNQLLDQIATELTEIYLQGKIKGDAITPNYVRDHYRGNAKLSFFDIYDQFVNNESRISSWAPATVQKFRTLRTHLKNMESSELQMDFAAISYNWFQKVFDYFLSIGHSNGTAKKNLKNLNWFLTWVVKHKGVKIRDVGTFKIKDKAESHRTAETIVFLRPDEFLLLFNAKIVNDTLERTRDLFCFLCATGLRVSDLQQLRSHHISSDGIKISTQKTGTGVTIPLNEFSRSLLDKYRDWPLLKENEVLPAMHPVNINKYLKTLGQVCGLNRIITTATTKKGELIKTDKPLHELLTCHAGRRTFVSLGIALNINQSVLKQFTGHQTTEMLDHYTGSSEEMKRREMAAFSSERLMKIS